MSHYDEYAASVCQHHAAGVHYGRYSRMHLVQVDETYSWKPCTAMRIEAWAEQQFERAERNWKAGATAMRQAATKAAFDAVHLPVFPADDPGGCDGCEAGWCQSSVDAVCVTRDQSTEAIRALPIPQEPK